MDLPIGYDLGAAAFDVTPRYKAGYAFTVGSDYSVTLVATMLDQDGKSLPLMSGAALEEGDAARSPVQVFTNREGRLVAQGLRPGRWIIELGERDKLRYVADIPQGTEGVIRLGTLSPNTDN
jgi:outer membrane usher protein